jgi:hypothetical protein
VEEVGGSVGGVVGQGGPETGNGNFRNGHILFKDDQTKIKIILIGSQAGQAKGQGIEEIIVNAFLAATFKFLSGEVGQPGLRRLAAQLVARQLEGEREVAQPPDNLFFKARFGSGQGAAGSLLQ